MNSRGMATIEASLVITLFLFGALALLQIGFVLITSMHVYDAFSQAVEQTAQEACIYETCLGEEGSNTTVLALVYERLQNHLRSDLLVTQCVQGGASGVFVTSCLLTDEKYIEAALCYRVRIVLPFFSLSGISFKEQQKQKAFLGYVAPDEAETYVYITDYQSVYHLTRSCTHLNLSISEVSAQELEQNYSGLSACSYCKHSGSKYYVTSEGDCYHESLACPGLKRTIYRVKKSSVQGKAPCSRCGGD